MTTAAALVLRARTAAQARGLSTERLDCLALGYGIRTGPWKGELLDLVRKAWGDSGIYAAPGLNGGWLAWQGVEPLGRGDAEVEALIAALEAAPLSLTEAPEVTP